MQLSHIPSSFSTQKLGQPRDEITVFDYLWVQRPEYNRLLLLSQPSSCFPITLTLTSAEERIFTYQMDKTLCQWWTLSLTLSSPTWAIARLSSACFEGI